jgi:FlaA1/EpsC-like NDP-sugar epimerase
MGAVMAPPDQGHSGMEFKDKRVVVTGAAGVFGRWIAAAFAR